MSVIDELPPESAVTQVVALKTVGETYCRAKFVSAHEFTPAEIFRLKRKLMQDLSPVLARAQVRQPNALYRLCTIHSFTDKLDLVVAGMIVYEGEML